MAAAAAKLAISLAPYYLQAQLDYQPPSNSFQKIKVFKKHQEAMIKNYVTEKPMVFIVAAIEEDMLKGLCKFATDFSKPFTVILLGDNHQEHLDEYSRLMTYAKLDIPSYFSL